MKRLYHVFDNNECLFCGIGMAFQKRAKETCPVRKRMMERIAKVIVEELVDVAFKKNNRDKLNADPS